MSLAKAAYEISWRFETLIISTKSPEMFHIVSCGIGTVIYAHTNVVFCIVMFISLVWVDIFQTLFLNEQIFIVILILLLKAWLKKVSSGSM